MIKEFIPQITASDINNLNLSPSEYYHWVDEVLEHFDEYILPVKTRIPLRSEDYFNVMPCVLPPLGYMGLKVVTRSEMRRANGEANIDGDILLYDYESCNLKALMDGGLITTIRTAAIAVHSMLHMVGEYSTIAMVGLGNIGTFIGKILFELVKDKPVKIKLYRYKNHAERFEEQFRHYRNLSFEICDNYENLMKDSDVVFSSVTFMEQDFCDSAIYKKGCTVIPVHMRGFKECDKTFDHVITSDLESIKKFQNYNQMRKLSLLNDVLKNKIATREYNDDRIIIYNLGIALYDIFFASRIYEKINQQS